LFYFSYYLFIMSDLLQIIVVTKDWYFNKFQFNLH